MSDAAKGQSTRRQLAGALLGAGIGAAMVLSTDPGTQFLSVTSDVAPPGALRMTLVVLLLAALYFFGGRFAARRRKLANYAPVTATGRPKLRRGGRRAGFAALQWQLMLFLYLVALAYPDQWTWRSVGLKNEVPIVVSVVAGIAAYGLLIGALTLAVRRWGDAGKFLDGTVRSMAMLCPRGTGQKAMAWIAFCVFNPVVEELLFRGVLVYQTALAVGSPWWPIAVGLLVNIGNHWYQGGRSMALHVPFYAIAVGLLFSPAGLAGAIAFHAAGDIVPMALVGRYLRQFRERHRRVESSGSSEKLLVAELS